jgi:hypothetical protein
LIAPPLAFGQNIDITDSLWNGFIKHQITKVEHIAFDLAKNNNIVAFQLTSKQDETFDTFPKDRLSFLGYYEWNSPYYNEAYPNDVDNDTVVLIRWSAQLKCGFDLRYLKPNIDSNSKIGLLSYTPNWPQFPEDTFAVVYLDYHELLNTLNSKNQLFLTTLIELRTESFDSNTSTHDPNSVDKYNEYSLDTFSETAVLGQQLIQKIGYDSVSKIPVDYDYSQNNILRQFLNFVRETE